MKRVPFLLASLLVAAGCGGTGKDQGSVVHRRLEGEPKTLNALLITSEADLNVLALLSRNLLDYDRNLELVPGLAEAVEEDETHRIFTVRLRPGVRWEDGTPVTADDVVATIRAIVDPKTPSLNRRAFFEGLETVEKVDERTARVVFSEASPTRRQAFELPLLPAAHYGAGDITTNPKNRAPLANGPYRLAAWTPGQTLELVRNTQYFGEKAPAEKVVFHVVPESTAALQGLLADQLDEARLSFEQYRRVEAESKSGKPVRPVVWDTLAYTYIGWDNRSPRFSDRRVRQAMTMLLDRDEMARTLYGGLAKPANGPVPPGLWTHDAALPAWPHDAARAEALLDEAGFRRGKDGARAKGGTRLAFSLAYGAGSDLVRQIAETIQQKYEKAGVAVTLQPMEWAAFVEAVDAGRLEASLLTMNLDPNPDLAPNWHSSQVPPNGMNAVFYANPAVDAAIDEIRRTFDRAKAKELYARAQRLIHEDEPFTFLHTVSAKWGVERDMTGVETSPNGLFLFWPGGSAWKPVRVKSPVS